MITYRKTNSSNTDFQKLVAELDADLKIRDGDDHDFYAELNKTDTIKYVLVAYEDEMPVGCGSIREYADDTMEVKRMFVLPNRRGEGIATEILKHLEKWAFDLNFKKCLLETGKNQPEAIALYIKSKYQIVPNFGKYKNVENSICFQKVL
jgi:GNAT superfamily N-acetyltransferase